MSDVIFKVARMAVISDRHGASKMVPWAEVAAYFEAGEDVVFVNGWRGRGDEVRLSHRVHDRSSTWPSPPQE